MSTFQYIFKSEDNDISLIGINGKGAANVGLFAELPIYEGHAFYETDEKLLIGSVCLNESIAPITKICKCSLSHCSNVKDVYISKHVRIIEWNMFGCSKLQNIYVESDNARFIDIEGVLYEKNKDQIEKIVGFPEGRVGSYTIKEGIKEICNCAFKSSSLSEIIIPDSVEVIGVNAFYNCNHLEEIVLPNNLRIFKKNCNPKIDGRLISIPQKLYLANDIAKRNPLTAIEVEKLFPE